MEAGSLAGVRTGLALAHSEGSELSVRVILRDRLGAPVPGGETSLSLSARGQLARFVEEIFEGAGIDFSEFLGSLEVQSPQPVSGIAIRLSPGEFATLPVTAGDSGFQLYFAHFADGAGISSALILLNPSATAEAKGTVELFQKGGTALSVDINGTLRQGSFSFQLPPLNTAIFRTDGLGPLVSGWARVNSDAALGGTVLFSGSFGVAGVGPVQPVARFLAPLELDGPREVQTGIALANPSSSPIAVKVQLRDVEGTEVSGGSTTIPLPSHGQLARFPSEIFEGKGLALSQFRGILEVEADSGLLPMAIRVSPGQFATLPVVPLN